jgi:hypothetical protein
MKKQRQDQEDEEEKEKKMTNNRKTKKAKKVLEARGGIEPPIKVLQTFALPLGYRATESGGNYFTSSGTCVSFSPG